MTKTLAELVGAYEAESLIRGVTTGRYHLLLGAGANFGGSSRGGSELPGGVDLATEIRDNFKLTLPDTHLKRAFKLARTSRSQDGGDFHDFIQARFTGVTPPAWMKQLVQFPWQRIWTLNIDDAVERAYDLWKDDAVVKARGVSWRESSSSLATDMEWVHVVHLHGRASKASRDGELVFSTTDYANAYGEKGFWHSVFAGEYEASPSIVVGASLDGEFDLETILERGKLSRDLPSFIVAPGISADLAREYRDYDLTPVAATASEFFQALHTATTAVRGRAQANWAQPMVGVAFEKTWKRLGSKINLTPDIRHDFYSGHEPDWSDVINDLVAVRNRIAGFVKRIADQRPGTFGVHVLTGEAYSGKSSAMLLAVRELHLAGFEPLLFVGISAPNADALAEYSRENPNAVFIVDGAEDFARDIGKLVHLHGPDHTIRVVLVDRSRALAHIKRNVPDHFRTETILRPELDSVEVARFYQKLQANNRLGYLATATRNEFYAHFQQRENRLFDGMAAIGNGRGFKSRVGDSYDKLEHLPGVELVRLAALASLFNYGIPLNSLTEASKLPVAEINRLVRESLVGDYVTINGEQLTIRSRHFGESLWNEFLTIPSKSETARKLVCAVAPLVSPTAISDDTLAYRIARSVMGHEFVLSIHTDSEAALNWYKFLERDYDWNARFWEQRALLASRAGVYEKAQSWALTAVSKLRDSFSLNTAGVVSMRRAVADAVPGKWPLVSFSEAEQYLRESRGRRSTGTGRDSAEYPYVSFFHGVLDIFKATGTVSDSERKLVEKSIVDWQLSAGDLNGGARDEVEKLMARVVEIW